MPVPVPRIKEVGLQSVVVKRLSLFPTVLGILHHFGIRRRYLGTENRRSDRTSRLEIREVLTLSDLRPLLYLPRVKIDFREDGIFMSQSAYTKRIINIANMSAAKPTKYLLLLSHPLYEEVTGVPSQEAIEMSEVPFWKVLHALFYLSTRTRPITRIWSAISMIAKFQRNPSICH